MMATYKITQMVEELYYIEADSEDDALEILYAGVDEPTQYGSMNITDITLCGADDE
jgi:hypothetical protein